MNTELLGNWDFIIGGSLQSVFLIPLAGFEMSLGIWSMNNTLCTIVPYYILFVLLVCYWLLGYVVF